MELLENTVKETLNENYFPSAQNSPPLSSVMQGATEGSSWTDGLADTDGFKEVKKQASKSLMNLNPVEFSTAVGRLEKVAGEVSIYYNIIVL